MSKSAKYSSRAPTTMTSKSTATTPNKDASPAPLLNFDMASSRQPPTEPTKSQPPSEPPLQRPRSPPPIYTPAAPSPRERLTRTPAAAPSLIPSSNQPLTSLFPTSLPPRPVPPRHTSYFGFYALPRPHISARPIRRVGGDVEMQRMPGHERSEESTSMAIDMDRASALRYRSRQNRTCLWWMRKRHAGMVVGAICIVILFWVLIGVGMGRGRSSDRKQEVGTV